MKISIIVGFIVFLFGFLFSESKTKKVSKKSPDSTKGSHLANSKSYSSQISLPSGLEIRFSNGPALKTLSNWASDLRKSGGTLSHGQAVIRETQVVQNINSGKWDASVYSEYQRMAAGSGNVDSANLLMEFGLGMTILETISKKDQIGRLHFAAAHCDVLTFRRIFEEEGNIDLSASDGTPSLLTAIFSGCIGVVQLILSVSALEVDLLAVSGAHGLTPIMAAASQGSVDVLRLLTDHLSSSGGGLLARALSQRHRFADTSPLHMAAELDHPAAISFLCSVGADPLALTSIGSSPLHTAAHSGASLSSIRALVRDCGVPVDLLMNGDTTPLYIAAHNGQASAVRSLLSLGADPLYSMPRPGLDFRGQKFLSRETDLVDEKFLAEFTNTEAGNGAQPLHVAVENGHLEAVRALLEGGGDADSMSPGASALHFAAQYNHPHIASLLLSLGKADVNLPATNDQGTALYYAAGRGFWEVAETLLSHPGISVDRGHRSGASPLIYSCLQGHVSVARMLLSAGADPNHKSLDGMTPLLASLSPHLSVQTSLSLLKLLLSSGASLQPRPSTLSQSEGTLHWAVRRGDKDAQILSFLLQTLASQPKSLPSFLLTSSSSSGLSPLQLASLRGDVPSIRALLPLTPSSPLTLPSPLLLACLSGSLPALRFLLDQDQRPASDELNRIDSIAALHFPSLPPSLSPLLAAIDVATKRERSEPSSPPSQLYASVSLLLLRGADPDLGLTLPLTPSSPSPSPSYTLFQSPLLLAVVRGSVEGARALLSSGARCDIPLQVLPSPSSPSSPSSSPSSTQSLVSFVRARRQFDLLQTLLSFPQCRETE